MVTDDSKPNSNLNPFAAPVKDPTLVAELAPDGPTPTLGRIAKRVFLAWEKLRVLYIAIAGAVTLLLGLPHVHKIEFWGTVIVGGLVSNACFFLGPVAETYLTWLGLHAKWLRSLLFAMGTLFTIIGAAVAVLSLAMPNQ